MDLYLFLIFCDFTNLFLVVFFYGHFAQTLSLPMEPDDLEV